jgi:hypothetical protein
LAACDPHIPFDLVHYLNQEFPGLHLDGGLFYRWPFGIRFDLGGRAKTRDGTDRVLSRATKLFEAAFDPKDSCVIVAQGWPGDDCPPIELSHLSSLFEFARRRPIGIGRPHGKVEWQDTGDLETGPSTLTWVTEPSRSFAYQEILEGIANADHARDPSIGDRVYFINTLTHVIAHMYDDRGMDLIATNRESLQSLYREFNEWILDYDRVAIDRMFDRNRASPI